MFISKIRSVVTITIIMLWLTQVFSLEWEEKGYYRSAPVKYDSSKKIGFTRISPRESGVLFTNILLPEYEIENQNLISGSGVALGDIDNDGLCDIYFCNLNGENKIYRNLGNFKFEDFTEKSGIKISNQLCRGAVFADVDGDNDLDLILTFNGRGARMFINDGKGHFTEDTQTEFSTKRGGTSIALGDVDRDGDLDLYVENYGENTILRGGGNFSIRMVRGKPVVGGRYATRLRIVDGKLVEVGEVDDFYLNDGKGKFIPVSWTDGHFLTEDGEPLDRLLWDYGLSVQIRDINQDGLPDIYVANDFHTPDRIWINQGNGKFRLIPKLALRKLSYASMGIDFSDIDRDGWLDLFDLEMMNREHEVYIREMTGVDPVFPKIGEIDNRPLVPRNTLFWNRGDGTYAEIAWYAGVAASDWSWCPVFYDVDLDGYEDLLIVNGHYRDVNDKDRVITTRTVTALMTLQESKMRILEYPPLATPNAAFRNRKDLTFEYVSHEWGFDAMETSHGIALADLDNDGDLDIVINCLNACAIIYRNDCPKPRIAVRLRGNPPNTHGINSKIKVYSELPMQFKEILCGNRYLSSDDSVVTFATGYSKSVTIEVDWLSGAKTVISNALPDRIYEIYEPQAPSPRLANDTTKNATVKTIFEDWTSFLNHTHHESEFDDFALQPLLPWRLSQQGPSVVWYDLDGDGSDELLISSGKGGRLSILKFAGKTNFVATEIASLTDIATDDQTGIVCFKTQNSLVKILVALSNYEQIENPGAKINCYDFDGKYCKLTQQIILTNSSAGPIAVADIDHDGFPDVFLGGVFIPGRYPETPKSAIYKFKNGMFVFDEENSRAVENAGMVNAAVWSDLNADGWQDLVLATEWGPIRIFINQNGVLREKTSEFGLDKLTGWWKSVATGDFNNDGLPDIVAGNWGLNSPYKASDEHPARLYYGDFNNAGLVDLLEAYSELTPGKIVPRRPLDEVAVGLPFVRGKFSTHAQYSKATVADILGEKLNSAKEVKANFLASIVLVNRGRKFEPVKLPIKAQLSPVFGISVFDYDNDGNEDIFLAQNFFALRLGMPRIDAGRGLLLKGDGKGGFTEIEGHISGLMVYGEQRGTAATDFDRDGRIDLVVSQNGAATKLFRNATAKAGLRIKLAGDEKNPDAIGSSITLIKTDVNCPVKEIQAGSGYRSQDGFVKIFNAGVGDKIKIRWYTGKETIYNVPQNAKEIIIRIDDTIKVLQ